MPKTAGNSLSEARNDVHRAAHVLNEKLAEYRKLIHTEGGTNVEREEHLKQHQDSVRAIRDAIDLHQR